MNVLVTYVQVLQLVATISERKQVIGLYSLAYRVTHVSIESTYSRLSSFINDYWVPLRRLQKDFESIAVFIAGLVLSVAAPYAKGRCLVAFAP